MVMVSCSVLAALLWLAPRPQGSDVEAASQPAPHLR